jgi:hypothetical protein
VRLERLANLHDYLTVIGERRGLHVLTNVAFEGGDPESIRVNLDAPNGSYKRVGHPPQVFSREQPPFEILSPSLLITADTLRQWQDNFASVNDAVGGVALGNLPAEDPANDQLLSQLQARSFEIAHIDTLLESLPVETPLYLRFADHPKTIDLIRDGTLAQGGQDLLDRFSKSLSVYSQIPELRRYFDVVQTGDLDLRGERLRQWFTNHGPLDCGDGGILEYVAYELKPLHLSGGCFHWRQDGDLRLVSVDLLCRYGDQPVWTEVKVQGDTWTSSAVLQILFYGAMIASGHQRRRLQTHFPERFLNPRPWLGVFVEQRPGKPEFLQDWHQAIAFSQHEAVGEALRPHFNGIIFVLLSKHNEGWAVEQRTVSRW